MTRHPTPGRRLGFTLIELLVVIIILGILIALIVPAVAGALRRGREAAVQAEISNLAQALNDFKNKFGDYPPSRIAIREDGSFNPGDTTALGATGDVTLGTLYLRGATAIRKFWPRVNLLNGTTGQFSGTLGSSPSSGAWYDFNGDNALGIKGNTTTSVYVLQGNQCLVFFLGGIPQLTTDPSGNVSVSVTGFGKNPLNPFSNSIPPTGTGKSAVPSPMFSANRNPPLYEFAPGRLRADGNGMAFYADSLNGPNNLQGTTYYGCFAYFSNNNGAGYDPNDQNDSDPLHEVDANQLSPLTLNFLTPQGTTASPSPNPYTNGLPSGTGVTTVTYINAQSFQLFSSGVDGAFGVGGYYNASPSGTGQALPPEVDSAANNLTNSSDTSVRTLEWDNLTNFHNGRLQ